MKFKFQATRLEWEIPYEKLRDSEWEMLSKEIGWVSSFSFRLLYVTLFQAAMLSLMGRKSETKFLILSQMTRLVDRCSRIEKFVLKLPFYPGEEITALEALGDVIVDELHCKMASGLYNRQA